MVKIIKLLRNNWKKSTFAFAVLSYGVNWGIDRYNVERIMRAFCEEAVKFGDKPVSIDKHRRITIILNPAANKRKAKKNFEKYCAPLFYLSGVFVQILETEKEGHAKYIIDKVDPNTDAIIVAGGDGTFSETITGLLRFKGELCKIPVGVLPLGKTNTLANTLFGLGDERSVEVNQMAKATMAVIKGHTQPFDALRIEALDNKKEDQKPIYGVNGIEWGMWHDIRKRQDKFWYFGSLRKYASLIFPGEALNKTVAANVRYTTPCSGCSHCYTYRPDLMDNAIPRAVSSTRWWGKLTFASKSTSTSPQKVAPVVNYKAITNEECSKINEREIESTDISVKTSKILKPGDKTVPHLLLSVGPTRRFQWNVVSDGLKYINGQKVNTLEDIHVKQVEIIPKIDKEDLNKEEELKDNLGNSSLSIDNEDYEVRPIRVTILPNSINIFCP